MPVNILSSTSAESFKNHVGCTDHDNGNGEQYPVAKEKAHLAREQGNGSPKLTIELDLDLSLDLLGLTF